MRIWLVCFGMLFAIAELYQWAKHLSLPLPIYILGGAFLAIASNNKQLGLFLQNSSAEPASVMSSSNSPTWDNLSPSCSNAASQRSPKPISFTINRSGEQNSSNETN